MPTKAAKVVKTFTAWSWSRYKDWLQCPFYARCRHLDKLAEPKGPALLRGGQVDELANGYIVGGVRKLPEPLKLFKGEFAMLRKVKALGQTRYAVNRAWRLVEFFAADAWGRMILDAHWLSHRGTVANVVDNKTGKVYPDNELQLELYAIPTLIAYPEVRVVRTALWYLDQGEVGGERSYPRSRLPEMVKGWERRLAPMLTDRHLAPRPGGYCSRCHYRKANGGPCKY